MYWYSLKIWFFAVVRLRAGLPCIFPRHGHHHLCHYHVLLWKGDFVVNVNMFYFEKVILMITMHGTAWGWKSDFNVNNGNASYLTPSSCCVIFKLITLSIISWVSYYIYNDQHLFFRMWKAVLLSPSQHPFGTPSSLWQHLGELQFYKYFKCFKYSKNYCVTMTYVIYT